VALASGTAPVINFSFRKEIIDLFCPLPATPTPLAPPTPPTPTLPSTALPVPKRDSYNLQCPTLLQANWKPGRDMVIVQFCVQYELGDGIQQKFVENSYTHAYMLRFMTVEELKDIKFRYGEIAALRDAVNQWSVPL
jgi:hypothetical protein